MRKIVIFAAVALLGLVLLLRPGTQAQDLEHKVFLPLVLRNYPPQACGLPQLLEPEDGAHLTTIAPLFRWDTGVVTDFLRFELQVSEDAGFDALDFYLVDLQSGQDEERIHFNLKPATLYHWRARNVCERGEGQWVVRSFTTGSGGTILPAPSLIEPLNAEVSSPVTFRWQGVTGAVEYLLSWRLRDGPYAAFVRTSDTARTIYISPGTYEWWVKARNSYAWGEPSATGVFTVTSTPGQIQTPAGVILCEGENCIKGGKR